MAKIPRLMDADTMFTLGQALNFIFLPSHYIKKRKKRQKENLNPEINFTAEEEAHEEGSSHHSCSALLPQAAPPPALPHFKSALPSCCQFWEHGRRTEPAAFTWEPAPSVASRLHAGSRPLCHSLASKPFADSVLAC